MSGKLAFEGCRATALRAFAQTLGHRENFAGNDRDRKLYCYESSQTEVEPNRLFWKT